MGYFQRNQGDRVIGERWNDVFSDIRKDLSSRITNRDLHSGYDAGSNPDLAELAGLGYNARAHLKRGRIGADKSMLLAMPSYLNSESYRQSNQWSKS